jgi:hypothetical protein
MKKHLINIKPHEVLAGAHLSTPVSLHVSISCGNPFKLRELDLELVLEGSDYRYYIKCETATWLVCTLSRMMTSCGSPSGEEDIR